MTRQAGDAKGTEGLEAGRNRNPQRAGMSWATMLAWIAFAFLVAGLVAYRLGDSFFSLKTFSKSDDNGIAGVYSRYEETGSRDRLGGPVDQQNGDAIEHGVDASATGANQRLRAKVQGLQAAGGGQQVKRLLQRQVA